MEYQTLSPHNQILINERNERNEKMIYIMKDIQSGMKINKVMKKYSITATLVLAILQIQSQ
jgi:Mor family transcriptional regulator